jgi:uncharacterized membrane protein
MRIPTLMATAALIVAACAPREVPDANLAASGQPETSAAPRPAGWDLQSSGEGVALVYNAGAGTAAIRLFCPAGENRFLVNVPAFRPIGSEERLSFGSGGTVVALFADPRGVGARGGVTGSGPLPADIKGLIEGPIVATYGAQTSGPHPVLSAEQHRQFVTACLDRVDAAAQAASRPNASTSPCLVQDGELLRMTPLRAIGTEPFWGARIEGRCVTYSHPEDQQGTRVWTRFNPGPQGGVWIGALGGKPFELRTRPEPGCSDGMSDNRYPIAVTLLVNGEQRTGCAEPLKNRS